MMKIYDTHAHLDHLEDLDGSLKRAAEAGVEGIVAVSSNLESCRQTLKIKEKAGSPTVHIAMGMHPGEVSVEDLPACLEMTRKHKEKLVAVGEIGLDFWYKWVRKDRQKKDEQMEVFTEFLRLAKDVGLPVIIHSRGAWKECLAKTREIGLEKALFHWYSGPVEILEELLEEGYYISCTPSLSTSQPAREAAERAPIDRTLIETDSPVYFRNKATGEGFQAEPKDVFKTLDAYCGIKGLKPEEAAARLNGNAEDFFNLKGESI